MQKYLGLRGDYPQWAAEAMSMSVYRLDNRPKTVALKGIDFTVGENQENLRAYLLVSFYFSTLLNLQN